MISLKLSYISIILSSSITLSPLIVAHKSDGSAKVHPIVSKVFWWAFTDVLILATCIKILTGILMSNKIVSQLPLLTHVHGLTKFLHVCLYP
jgi:hypothetical protein